MAKLLKLRRGTTTQHASFTGAEGEVTIDTTKDTAVVHDGSQAGGRPLLREDMSNLPAGTIDNADVNASAAISGTKISPDFGSQDITTTGKIKFANVYATEGDLPSASTYHGMFAHVHATGLAYYAHGGNWIKLAKLDAPDFTGGIDVTGNVIASGNITANNGTMTVSGTAPKIEFTETNDNPDYKLEANGGNLAIVDTTNSATKFSIGSATTSINNNLDVASGLDVTGNITSTGNVDATGFLRAGGTYPRVYLTDSDNDSDWVIINNNGAFVVRDDTNGTSPLTIAANGQVTVNNNLDISNGCDVTGNITVSGTVDGRDVAADGTKLDGIESGATADQTGAEIATALNGQSIYTTGNIGRDANDHFAFVDDTRLDIYLANSNEFRFQANGEFHADGDITAFSSTVSSDEKLKENIEVIPNALEKVEALNGVSFTWKRDGTPSAGVIAQDVQKVLPEAVKEVTPVKGGDSHLSVNYHALTSILIESIKELKAEIEELKGGK